MDDLRWSPDDSVGVPELDADHREMYELADSLRYALVSGAPPAQTQALLDELLEATLAHFEQEEGVLAQTDYPELAAHRRSHDRLLRTLLHFRADVRHERYNPAVAAKFIQAWVVNHVRDEDARYAGHVQSARAMAADTAAPRSATRAWRAGTATPED